jgi:iron(III) transport system ATP-binding protein
MIRNSNYNAAFLRLDNLNKRFGSAQVIKNVDVLLASGETLAILGPSGCGKSTLLRLIAGLERPDGGHISLNQRSLDAVAPDRRGVGLVFQDHALFGHLNVFDNVAYGLVERSIRPAVRQGQVMQMLELVQMADFAKRHITQLSGGERQRVALARTLVLQPLLLLLDEPFASLDARLRDDLRAELRLLFENLQQTTIFVTHDQRDAFALADQIAMMQAGQIIQQGNPRSVFQKPANAWVAKFLGQHNLVHSTPAAALGLFCPVGQALLIPEHAIGFGSGRLAVVRRLVFEGQQQRLWLSIADTELQVTIPGHQVLSEQVYISIDQDLCIIMEAGQ